MSRETRRHGASRAPRSPGRSARRLAVTVVLALGAMLPVVSASPAKAADGWIVGTSKQSTILNCVLLTQGITQVEAGINVVTAYHGTLRTSPTVGQPSYMTTVMTRIGTHCSTPIVFPKFVLPSGVVFNTSEPIECYGARAGESQIKVTNPLECPQWSAVAADGRYTSGQAGWSGGWPLPSNDNWDNGSSWEFVVPIRATSVQDGSKIRAAVDIADGYDNPTLTSEVTFYAPSGATASVPGAPTGTTASATSSTSASVAFAAPANNGGAAITGYNAQCVSSNGGTTRTATGGGAPLTVTGLTAAKQYHCQVRAQNSAGWGGWSSWSSYFTTPGAATAPGAPTGVVLTELSLTEVRATFTPPASTGGSAISSYWVQCWQQGINDVPAGDSEGPGVTHTIDDLIPGRSYRCRVLATNAAGLESPWSEYSAWLPLGATVPDAPTSPTVTAKTATTATVAIAAPVNDGGDPVTAYAARCESTDGGVTGIDNATASPVVVPGLTPGKQYRCQAHAMNSKGWGTWSTWSPTFTTLLGPLAPGAPTAVTTAATSPTTANVMFTAPANGGAAITGYGTQCVSTDGGTARTATSTGSPATVTALTAGKQYRCQVRAQNSQGWGDWSAYSATFTTPTAPDPVDPGTPGTGTVPVVWSTIDESALKRKGKWKTVKSATYVQGAARTTKKKGAELRTRGKVRVSGITLVATTCKKCGKVVVYHGKLKVAKISLKSATTQNGRVLGIKNWSSLQKAKKIRIVVVTKGKRVTIDGVGVRTR